GDAAYRPPSLETCMRCCKSSCRPQTPTGRERSTKTWRASFNLILARRSESRAMTDKTSPTITSEIIDKNVTCTLEELCRSNHVEAQWIMELVEHGVIEPVGQVSTEWHFASLSLVRVAKAKRLRQDLDLNPAGVALVIDLLDEIEELRARLQS